MKKTSYLFALTAVCGLLEFGCSNADIVQDPAVSNYGVSSEYSVTKNALLDRCELKVDLGGGNIKTVNFESDYLPNVTYCELGGSNYEALRMQAILGRSFAYYHLKNGRTTLDAGTNDQVYSCPSYAPTEAALEKCRKAVEDTSGIVVYRNNNLICTFYRSGCTKQYLDENCVWHEELGCTGHARDTQDKITYNWGNSGSSVNTLYKAGDPADSGCLSHNGSYCLSEKGWVYPNIIKFFYGMDTELRKIDAPCEDKAKCETQLDGAETIIDDRDHCFSRKVSDNYYTMGTTVSSASTKVGYNDSLQFAYTTDKAASAEGTWKVKVKTAGTYQIFAYVDSNAGKLSKKAVYEVRADSNNKKVTVDLSSAGWVEIGKFKFAAGEDQWVKLTDATGEAYTDGSGTRVVFDALKFVATAGCSDECASKGAKECHGAGYRTCDDINADGCLEWSDETACKSGEECKDGSCYTPEVACTDDCEEGAAECVNNNGGFRKCGQFDADDCLDWSEVENCGAGFICRNAACVENDNLDCENECQDGQTKCGENGVITCGQFDDDECLEWSETEKACNTDLVCKNGKCVDKSSESGSDTGKYEMPDDCLTEVDGKETIVDELDDCFVKSDSKRWLKLNEGYDDHLYYAYVRENKEGAVGTWYLNVTKSGTYDVSVYIASSIGDIAKEVEYSVKAGNRMYHPTISVSSKKDGWVNLGKFDFKKGVLQYIELTDKAFNAEDEVDEMRVVYDAIRITPEGSSSNDSDKDKDKVVSSSGSDCSVGGNAQNSFGLWMMLACFSGLMLLRRRKFSH